MCDSYDRFFRLNFDGYNLLAAATRDGNNALSRPVFACMLDLFEKFVL